MFPKMRYQNMKLDACFIKTKNFLTHREKLKSINLIPSKYIFDVKNHQNKLRRLKSNFKLSFQHTFELKQSKISFQNGKLVTRLFDNRNNLHQNVIKSIQTKSHQNNLSLIKIDNPQLKREKECKLINHRYSPVHKNTALEIQKQNQRLTNSLIRQYFLDQIVGVQKLYQNNQIIKKRIMKYEESIPHLKSQKFIKNKINLLKLDLKKRKEQ